MIKILLLVAWSANAGNTRLPTREAAVLVDRLKQEGVSATVSCEANGDCNVSWAGSTIANDRQAIAAIRAYRTALEQELATLMGKMDDGSANMADIRRFAKITILVGRR